MQSPGTTSARRIAPVLIILHGLSPVPFWASFEKEKVIKSIENKIHSGLTSPPFNSFKIEWAAVSITTYPKLLHSPKIQYETRSRHNLPGIVLDTASTSVSSFSDTAVDFLLIKKEDFSINRINNMFINVESHLRQVTLTLCIFFSYARFIFNFIFICGLFCRTRINLMFVKLRKCYLVKFKKV